MHKQGYYTIKAVITKGKFIPNTSFTPCVKLLKYAAKQDNMIAQLEFNTRLFHFSRMQI